MKITAIAISNFKRLREVKLAPPADTYVLLIGGANAAGKTSILDALTAAFGGSRATPADPVRHGSDHAEIRVELDGGDLVVRRKITEAGEQLEVRDADGVPVRKPQQRLDALVGRSFLDPLAWLQLKEPEQRARLLEIIPEAEAIAGLDVQRAGIFEKRTDVNRQLKHAEGELARMPVVDPVEEVDVGELYRRIGEARSAGLASEQAARREAAASVARSRAAADVERIERDLALARERSAQATAEHEAAAADASRHDVERDRIAIEIAKLEAEARAAADVNRRAGEASLALVRRAGAEQQAQQLRERSERLTAALESIDAQKSEALAAAKLPVPGLGFNDQGVLFQGVPLAQASGAEKLRVALALAIATRPELRDVWIRDGALLDDDSLALVADAAKEAGVRVWIERVGEADDDAIIITDGTVAAGKGKRR